MNRRSFLHGVAGAAAFQGAQGAAAVAAAEGLEGASLAASIDHRYSPLSFQSAICFPDDPFKSLVGERGELRYGHPGQGASLDFFTSVVEFSLAGMEPDRVARQELEAPGSAVVHTRLARPEAALQLTAFATREAAEGRVDNVIAEATPAVAHTVHVVITATIRTRRKLALRRAGTTTVVHAEGEPDRPFLIADEPLTLRDAGWGYTLAAPAREATADRPARCFFRFPQEGQGPERLAAGLRASGNLLAAARDHWREWRPFSGEVDWKLAGTYQNFAVACARNIQQAREERNGRLTFQVGPTVYRGLWVVDGNFLLEAARYLGYDAEARQGLETTWSYQEATGGVFAGAGRSHWKDTGIAIFTLVRQAELSGDWSYFREMKPQVLRAVEFLSRLREQARTEGSANGKYGLLARGMADGGIGGVRSEFTNTIWVLAGLRAAAEAADAQHLEGYEPVRRLYAELRAAFFAAAKQEMRTHPAGFEYLPMLMKEDAQWGAAAEWDRPRPQSAQWALSHAIYPGLVFERNDPIVRGHIRLMQAVTQEDVPAETGWLPHEGLWTYNAPFVSHAYLWAGEPGWARMAFTGFLNHATPLYCWREEQPLRGSAMAGYVGDMPHNWASAECVLYLRHMLALEDGGDLRLLAALSGYELDPGQPYTLRQSPTRFGRVNLNLEPLGGRRGWRLEFHRGAGPAPKNVVLPSVLGERLKLAGVQGCGYKQAGSVALVDPAASTWAATWSA